MMDTIRTAGIAISLFSILHTNTALAVDLSKKAALEAEQRIALAAEEGAVVEDIVKAACMIHEGVDTDRHAAMISHDLEVFDKVLLGLRYGSADLGISAEKDGEVLKEIRETRILWLPFQERAEKVLAAESVDMDAVRALTDRDLPLLAQIDKLVDELQREYGDGVVPLHIVLATKLAVRQETILQRVAKGACLITAGIDPDRMRATMAELLGVFEATHTALRDGMPPLGIRPPQSEALNAQYMQIENGWQEIRHQLEVYENGDQLDQAGLGELSRSVTSLMRELKAAVVLYQGEI